MRDDEIEVRPTFYHVYPYRMKRDSIHTVYLTKDREFAVYSEQVDPDSIDWTISYEDALILRANPNVIFTDNALARLEEIPKEEEEAILRLSEWI